jgi:hypothetical protein
MNDEQKERINWLIMSLPESGGKNINKNAFFLDGRTKEWIELINALEISELGSLVDESKLGPRYSPNFLKILFKKTVERDSLPKSI